MQDFKPEGIPVGRAGACAIVAGAGGNVTSPRAELQPGIRSRRRPERPECDETKRWSEPSGVAVAAWGRRRRRVKVVRREVLVVSAGSKVAGVV